MQYKIINTYAEANKSEKNTALLNASQSVYHELLRYVKAKQSG